MHEVLLYLLSLCYVFHSAYRFFPILVVFTVTFVCFLSRDFGPMLTAERSSRVMVTERSADQDEQMEQETEAQEINGLCVRGM